ncbi:prepilin-type N-terminal cleavage/methylation domain-containing protein [Clostridium tertium]|jgi:type IV pilus assembly protein PilA|uniref:prepilin-type N-terminal cleavage/methylation domain-containing protein n=1 Tax=Clostridium tertium TaxID=1559 RepID=UPI00189D3BC9|nr:prepilin-type N-terminal cleavage/methylation domain-containing protein [Clostridium tertium]MDB1946430.1 prepilin-type N-terminal cleavage/methylation domain-containing protein [Clostridium tertium]
MVNNLKNKKKKKGFTLIELIIVIAIIAILAALAIPKFGEVRKDAAFKSDIANAKTIANSVASLITENKLSDGTYYVDSTKDSTTNVIEDYLQNSPSPKSKDYTVFKVVVSKGNAAVTMEKSQSSTGGVELFPVAATSVN